MFMWCRELYTYISTELRELDPEELNAFLDAFTKHILDLVKSPDTSSKLGGILAIVALINAEACNTGDRISRFGNYLRNNCLAGQATAYSNSDYTDGKTVADAAVIELASKAIARLMQVSGAYTVNLKLDLIDHEMKRSIEVLQGGAAGRYESNESRRYAAVLVLREIAFSMPTFFFQVIYTVHTFQAEVLRRVDDVPISHSSQNVNNFFRVIFSGIADPNQLLREASVNTLRAALVLVAQRETTRQSRNSQHNAWYEHVYNLFITLDPRRLRSF